MEPLVDEMSILEVVTQSSRGRVPASQLLERTQSGDETLMDILADLVGDGEEEEATASNDEEVEERRKQAQEGDREQEGGEDDDEEKETLEMTQVWIPPYLEAGKDDAEEVEEDTDN